MYSQIILMEIGFTLISKHCSETMHKKAYTVNTNYFQLITLFLTIHLLKQCIKKINLDCSQAIWRMINWITSSQGREDKTGYAPIKSMLLLKFNLRFSFSILCVSLWKVLSSELRYVIVLHDAMKLTGLKLLLDESAQEHCIIQTILSSYQGGVGVRATLGLVSFLTNYVAYGLLIHSMVEKAVIHLRCYFFFLSFSYYFYLWLFTNT